MPVTFPNLNSYWAYLIIEEFIRLGLDYFILSPGSRCTPLTVAVANQAKARKIIYYDERSAAFHAIGYAHATGKPAILICTSGTATANYYPAVIEASLNQIPLIILSADRPPELQQTGANQTIQQNHLYGQYVKAFFSLPCPSEAIPPAMVLTTIDQAVYQSHQSVVHLNCAFREPLAPTSQNIPLAYLKHLEKWDDSGQPYTTYFPAKTVPDDTRFQKIIEILEKSQMGLLVIGRLSHIKDLNIIITLMQKLNWPVFADIQSGIRLHTSLPQLIPYFEQLFLSETFCKHYPFETVLQIGDRLTSQRYHQWLKQANLQHYIVVTASSERHDPEHLVTDKVESDLPSFCQIITDKLAPRKDNSIILELQKKSQTIAQFLDDFLLQDDQINEPAIAYLISRSIPSHHGLFLANSMTIREMDRYGIGNPYPLKIAANRGTSGIEGTIASATGFLKGLQQPVTLMIGDLAFLHDLNSLVLLNSLDNPLTIILINNNGGGIFSFLPIAQFTDVFEPYFGTPHHRHFASASELFNLNYYQPQTLTDFSNCYEATLSQKQSSIIEVMTQRESNYELHQQLERKIKDILFKCATLEQSVLE